MNAKSLIQYLELEAGYPIEECYEEHWCSGDVDTAGSLLLALFEWKKKHQGPTLLKCQVVVERDVQHIVTPKYKGPCPRYKFVVAVELRGDTTLQEASGWERRLEDQIFPGLAERLESPARYVAPLEGHDPYPEIHVQLGLGDHGGAELYATLAVRVRDPQDEQAMDSLFADMLKAMAWLGEEGFSVERRGW